MLSNTRGETTREAKVKSVPKHKWLEVVTENKIGEDKPHY